MMKLFFRKQEFTPRLHRRMLCQLILEQDEEVFAKSISTSLLDDASDRYRELQINVTATKNDKVGS